jgi:hypothetical protein
MEGRKFIPIKVYYKEIILKNKEINQKTQKKKYKL